jgi:hypothetical protein
VKPPDVKVKHSNGHAWVEVRHEEPLHLAPELALSVDEAKHLRNRLNAALSQLEKDGLT